MCSWKALLSIKNNPSPAGAQPGTGRPGGAPSRFRPLQVCSPSFLPKTRARKPLFFGVPVGPPCTSGPCGGDPELLVGTCAGEPGEPGFGFRGLPCNATSLEVHGNSRAFFFEVSFCLQSNKKRCCSVLSTTRTESSAQSDMKPDASYRMLRTQNKTARAQLHHS